MIHLNIASNLNSYHGSRYDNISSAIQLLIEAKIQIEKISNFYETPSYPNQRLPKFLNVGILVNKNLSLLRLFKDINLIQKKIGRNKTKKNDPRVIDIDILYYQSKVINQEKLIIPHKLMHERKFVMIPLNDLNENHLHPILKITNKEILNKCIDSCKVKYYGN